MIFIESRSEVVDGFGTIVSTGWSLKVIARLESVKKKKLLVLNAKSCRIARLIATNYLRR
jgi:hypothetical protein